MSIFCKRPSRRLYVLLFSLAVGVAVCHEAPETPAWPRTSQIPPDYKPPDALQTAQILLRRFEQSEAYAEPEKKSSLEWRQVRPLPNIQFELPAKIDFEANYAILNEKTNSNSLSPLALERYSYIDLSLKKYLQKHPEQQGSEASTASIYFEIIPKLKLKEYIQRRLKENQLFSPEVKRVSKPRNGFYVKSSDMFTYQHELWLENGNGIYRFEAVEPNGSIPEKSRLTPADILHILFSLKIIN
jgi:hypothetical protein